MSAKSQAALYLHLALQEYQMARALREGAVTLPKPPWQWTRCLLLDLLKPKASARSLVPPDW